VLAYKLSFAKVVTKAFKLVTVDSTAKEPPTVNGETFPVIAFKG
jgi:hypothetical protein